ncbi:hypothetical protein CTKA_01919 [Chthonomonas calidirosea]|uniref:Outer membrane lipoprotein-sorting protein n=1 Tax=Chthonomonas calidirosea (strain DSM 23976 / ICMP 18418 / T49) TaxID=1303518 RepID=S0EVY4_CHTCT|nr:DUF2092 domain-containing protein [Chthonomonas calidirosea]CCW35982.1 hypothetical protein CCALI_02175 [Chthonomonas calidirosea T49]CEK18677.1 hypothetical protein CTKA_01919 [Chthonomonas calidirosea]
MCARPPSLGLLFGLAFLLHSLCSANATPLVKGHQQASPFDPKALQLLDETLQTYKMLSSLQEETVFSAYNWMIPPGAPVHADIPDGLKPQSVARTLTLSMLKPNLFRMELKTTDTNNKVQTALWVCDGTTFWTYNSEKNYYTKHPAPSDLAGLAKLPGMDMSAPEVMMLLGQNPFANIQDRFDGARLLPPLHLEGLPPLDGVEIWQEDTTKNLIRLYISPQNHLIYRIVFETLPLSSSHDPSLVGDDVDALAIRRPVSSGDSPSTAFALVCDNKFGSSPTKEAFHFSPPRGALLFQPLNSPQDLLDYLQRNMQKTDLHHMLRGRKARIIRP